MDGFTPLTTDPGLYDQLIDQQLQDQLAKLAQWQLAPDIKKEISATCKASSKKMDLGSR